MAISFPSPLSKPERLTMITPLHSPRRDPPSKKRRVEGHALLFSIRKKVRWLVLHQVYEGKGGVDLFSPEGKGGATVTSLPSSLWV